MASSKSSAKIEKYIWLSVALYVLLCGCVVLFSFKYVEAKRDRLRAEAWSELNDFFENQSQYVMVGFSGEKVAYEKGELPKYIELPDSFNLLKNTRKAEWDERYGNLYKIYNLKPKWKAENEFDADRRWTGWLLYIIESTGMGFKEYQIYPRSVGYFKQSDHWMYDYAPSVQSAVDAAFEFHTTNPKSSYYGKLADVNRYTILNKVRNEYYQMFSYDYLVEMNGQHYADSIMTWSPWSLTDNGYISFARAKDQIGDDGGAMYNGYYRVDNTYAPIAFWDIVYDVWNDPQTKDRNDILLYGLISLSVLFVGILVFLFVKKSKATKIETESIKQNLLRVCHPNNFMKPFDKEKVDCANTIYARIMETSEDDIVTLKGLRSEAQTGLGISFIDENVLEDLTSKCNPQNYMNPYNAEKVSLATELYALLQDKIVDIDKFEEILEKSKDL